MRPMRPLTMRRPSTLLLATLLGLALAPFPQSPASASCAGPHLDVEDGRMLSRSAAVTITGQWFVDGCQDTMSCGTGLGCDSCEYDDPPPLPYDDVALELRQDGRSWELAVVDADKDGSATWTFTVPGDARRGPAQLVPDHGESVRVGIR